MNKILLLSIITILSFTTAQTQVTGLAGWDIFLDPGHSQKENMGIYNYSEAEKNLRVALYLRDLLLTTTDIDTVYLSRTNDQQQVSLEQRTDMANQLGATWFHSIHSDAGSSEYTSTLLLWGQYYSGQEKNPPGGKAMSDIMNDLLTRGMRTNTRGSIGDCSFYTWSTWCQESGGPYLWVNRTTDMPSELSEAGFHTNPTQNQLNMNAEFRKLQAYTYYWSILEFHSIPRPPVGIATGIITDLESGLAINGATVEINGQNYTTDTYESLFYKYSSDPDQLRNGFYFIEGLPDTTLDMIVSAPDYMPDTVQVTINNSFFTFTDFKLVSTIPPKVISSTPADGEINFNAYNPIYIDFSRPMDRTAVQNSLQFSPDFTAAISWLQNSSRLKIKPDSLQFLTDYIITIGPAATDKYNHQLDGNGDGTGGDEYVLHFRSGPSDIWPPRITANYPVSNATGIDLQPIIGIVYDELLDPASVDSSLFVLAPTNSPQTPVSGILKLYTVKGRSVLDFFPQEKLLPSTNYRIRISPGFSDLLGNTILTTSYYYFTTTDYDPVLTSLDALEGAGITSNWWVPTASGSTIGIIPDTSITRMTASSEYTNLLSNSSYSMKLKFGWDTLAPSWLIREYLGGGAPRNARFDISYLLQVYIFGDGSNVKFRFAVDDKYVSDPAPPENHEVSPWYTVNWYGWKLVSWDPSRDGTGVWLGDGVVEGTLRFDSFQLSYEPGQPPVGVLYFDDLRLAKKNPLAVEDIASELIPAEYTLVQNFPNPFNPVTTIRFGLPQSGHVTLSVYDMTGRLCNTLVNDFRQAGFHTVTFDGSTYASGVYLYMLHTDEIVMSQKMILIK